MACPTPLARPILPKKASVSAEKPEKPRRPRAAKAEQQAKAKAAPKEKGAPRKTRPSETKDGDAESQPRLPKRAKK